MRTTWLLVATCIAGILPGGAALAQSSRDYVSIVGSSTVYPFTTAVAEQFGRSGAFRTPKVESTGTGGGIKLFCNGVGVQYPDIVNASRRIKQSELAACAGNGVRDVLEVKIGYDGIVVATSRQREPLRLTRKEVFLALASQVPDPANPESLIPNPYGSWKDVNPALPPDRIEVLGPPPTSGTRDAFAELVMEEGCSAWPWIKAMKSADEKRFRQICHRIREDGAWVEAGENDNLIVQKLQANPKAVGIFGYSFLEENLDKVRGALVDGVEPTFENIAAGRYPVSRPLFVYVKKAHIGVIPGLKEFIAEYTSERAFGAEGYLVDKGLIPLPASERTRVLADVAALRNVRL